MRSKLVIAVIAAVVVGLLVAYQPVGAGSNLGRRVRALERKVKVLQNKTRQMHNSGAYLGFVHTTQVYTEPGNGECIDGDDAVWVEDPRDPNYAMLWCTIGPYSPSRGKMVPRSGAEHAGVPRR